MAARRSENAIQYYRYYSGQVGVARGCGVLSEDGREGPATVVEGEKTVSLVGHLIRPAEGKRGKVHVTTITHSFFFSPLSSLTDLVLSSVVSLMSLNRPIVETTPTHTSKLAHRHSRPIYTMTDQQSLIISPSHKHTAQFSRQLIHENWSYHVAIVVSYHLFLFYFYSHSPLLLPPFLPHFRLTSLGSPEYSSSASLRNERSGGKKSTSLSRDRHRTSSHTASGGMVCRTYAALRSRPRGP